MYYRVISLKQHTTVPKVSGYYIMEYKITADEGQEIYGTAKVYYRVDKYLVCTEDSNDFKYFGPCDMRYFVDSIWERRTYFSRINPTKTVLWENEIEAIKEYVINGIKESHGCTIVEDFGLLLHNGNYEIPLTWRWIRSEFFTSPILKNMLRKNLGLYSIKDFHNITPVEEDTGYSFTNDGTFTFTCPVCTNEKSPAGFLKMPRPFYENNRPFISGFLRNSYKGKFLINDPNYKIPSISGIVSYMSFFPDLVFTERVMNKLAKWSNYHSSFCYRDYYAMFKEMYPDAEPMHILDVKDGEQIKDLHDKLMSVYVVNKDKIKAESYLRVKNTFPKYEFSDENFTIFYPEKIDDIAQEGTNLHHCVGSYINRIISRKNIILFLRKNDALDESFVTVDIIPKEDKYEIEQAHGKHNCMISTIPGVPEFINKWAKKFNIVINNLNKVC